MQLKGRKAVISGASRGIGLAIAKAFALRGASTVLLGRSQKTLDVAIKSLECASEGQSHEAHQLDVTQASEWDSLMNKVSPADVLVNVAGDKKSHWCRSSTDPAGITHYSLLPRTSVSTIDDVLSTNLLGPIYGSRAFSKAMLRNSKSGGDGACIINISSALAHRNGSGSTVYAASKAGLIGFTKAFAEEFGPRGLRTCALAPGYIDTDMVSGMSKSIQEKIIERTSVRRIGTVDEVAQAAVFLVENDFANGTTLTIDGGFTFE